MKKVLIGVVLTILVGLIGFGVYWTVFRDSPVAVGSEAEGLEAIRPRNMRITEITDTSFMVSWNVQSSVSGYIKYGDTSTSISLIAQDVRGAVPSEKHEVKVSGLEPGKKYYFWVMSDEVAFGRDGRALEVLTLAE